MIVLVRHGCWDPELGILTIGEARRSRALGVALAASGVSPDPFIVSAPEKRVLQTAEELAKAFMLTRRINTVDVLGENCTDFTTVIELLERHSVEGTDLIIVTIAPIAKTIIEYLDTAFELSAGSLPKDIEPCQAIVINTKLHEGLTISVPA